ncbi:MAG: cyclic nucleotide-binding domain-containing protein [Treponemataceae bacterium]
MKIKPIAHEGTLRVCWDLLILAAVVAAIIETPLSLVFKTTLGASFNFNDDTINLLFLLDILVNFNTTYTEKRKIVSDRAKIVRRYLTSGFTVDVLSAIPFAIIDLLGLPVLRMLRILKLVTALRVLKKIKQLSLRPSLLRMALMIFWLAVAVHLIACGFLYIGGVPKDGGNGIIYLRALYWTVTTVATIGYGDITPDRNNPVQLIYTIITELIGVGMFGFIIGNIASLIANIDLSKTQHRAKMDEISAYLQQRSIPRDLRNRISDYYDYLWENRRGQGENAILGELPLSLKTQVSMFLNKDIIEKVPLFKGAGSALIEEIVTNMRAVVYLPGDYIIKKGELGEDMFFISQGSVNVVSEDEKTVYATLGAGSFFGEMALLLSLARTATIKAVEYCDLYTLRKAAFEQILTRHPAFGESIRLMAEERRRELETRG